MDINEIIRSAKENCCKSLNLSSMNLKEIPDSIYELDFLERLTVSKNLIEEIPDKICKLKNLKYLDISYNCLSILSDRFFELYKLKELKLNNNYITKLSDKILNLKNLNAINLRNNQLKEIPMEMIYMENIDDIDIRNNKILELPVEIENYKGDILIKYDQISEKQWLENSIYVINEINGLNRDIRTLERKVVVILPFLELEEFPEKLFKFKEHVIEINLKNNKIKEIPKEIKEFKNLVKLDLTKNLIEEIPKELYDLNLLTEIDLSYNKIKKVSSDIGKLKNVNYLNLSNNKLGDLPDNLGEMYNLRTLNIQNNLIEVFPKGIFSLYNLEKCYLGKNKLKEIPESLSCLKNLKRIDLSYNCIEKLPEDVAYLCNLESLDVRGNLITSIPQDLINSKKIKIDKVIENDLIKIVDLTQKLDNMTPVYPGDFKTKIVKENYVEKNGYNNYYVEINMHSGTHIDGPMHMTDSNKHIYDFGLDRFIGEGCILDVRGQKNILVKNGYNEKIREGCILLLYTGQSMYYGKNEYYENYPVLDTKFAEFLVKKRIKAVGIDSPSPDRYPFDIHKLLLRNNIFIIENLTNLGILLNVKQFEVISLPLKIETDSSVARVVAKLIKQ